MKESDELTPESLEEVPGYRPGCAPQYYEYHQSVDWLDEMERIYGKKWGAQGIGRLREVAVTIPTDTETHPLYEKDPAFFLDTREGGGYTGKRQLEKMRAQVEGLVEVYRSLGIHVHVMKYDEKPRSAYGPLKRSISAAAAFVINGGAIMSREPDPMMRGRTRYVAEWLTKLKCPILYTVHGKGVAELACVRMADDFLVAMLSTAMDREGLRQIMPVLKNAGYKVWVARSPGSLYRLHPKHTFWAHPDMWIAPLDRDLALIDPRCCDYETIRYLKAIGYELLEAPWEEQDTVVPLNMLTVEPRKVIMINRAPKTRKLLEENQVEVIEVEYDEVVNYGGGIRCTTARLIRDEGPKVFESDSQPTPETWWSALGFCC